MNMQHSVYIAIVGDFNPDFHSHQATNEAIGHAAAQRDFSVNFEWVPTTSVQRGDALHRLSRYDGIWASPGSPYQSQDGMLAGIEFARIRNVPFVGT